jgi:hypothetical protein
MIKLFRNIRQNLLKEGKTSKYFKYAIGEIILVVIGILIALQINNWNEHQKAIKKEAEVIASLKQEITTNINDLEKILKINETFLIKTDSLLEILNGDFKELPTSSTIARVFDYETLAIEIPELDNIIESNSELLIKRKNMISEFRELKFAFNRVKESQVFLDEFWNSKVTSFFISCGIYLIPNQNEENNITLKEMIDNGYSIKQFKALVYAKQGLLKVWSRDQKIALQKSKEVLEILNNS